MKFVMSYSGGKDSVLALHKMLEARHEPVGLLVMVNIGVSRSWFHGIDLEMLNRISSALGIQLIMCESDGNDYHTALERGLLKAKEMGAQACAFGDLDIEEHREWCLKRCEAARIKCVHPLWRHDRLKNTDEVISLGYKCIIKCIRNADLPKDLLGKALNYEIVEDMKKRGIDVCGENGEYHTAVLDGPIFKYPVDYELGEILDFGNISAIDIKLK